MFQVMDEATRFFLGAWWDRRIDGKMGAEYFDHLCRHYGPPEEIRRDDGPEFRSREFQRVCRRWRVRQRVIPPGSPYWNGFIESLHGKEEIERLSREEIEDFWDARIPTRDVAVPEKFGRKIGILMRKVGPESGSDE
nr:DDE-type integrase/transposase/recombinase [Thermosulfurimonas sp. F29]